eukprot:4200956-Prymnesium_polylepis.1
MIDGVGDDGSVTSATRRATRRTRTVGRATRRVLTERGRAYTAARRRSRTERARAHEACRRMYRNWSEIIWTR